MCKVIRVIFSLFVFFMSFSAFGQVATGVYSNGTFDNKGFDTINVANLNVNFGIPIFAKQGRGGLNFQFGLNYDSSIWAPITTSGTTSWQPAAQWGWTGRTERRVVLASQLADANVYV